MLDSAQQIKKIDLDDYVFNHQGFRVTNITLHNLQNTNLMISPIKTAPAQVTLSMIINKRKKKKQKEKKSKHVCKPLLGIFVEFP